LSLSEINLVNCLPNNSPKGINYLIAIALTKLTTKKWVVLTSKIDKLLIGGIIVSLRIYLMITV